MRAIRKLKRESATIPAEQLFAVRLMEHLVVPTFVLDAQGCVLIWNKACERLTGLAAGEVVGTRAHWRAFYDAPRPCLADLIVQGQSAKLGSLYEEHVQTAGQMSLSAENWCEMPHLERRRYLAIDAGPIFDDFGNLIAVVETLRDITVQRSRSLPLRRSPTATV